jgi:trans-aconitate methyltransferase
MMFQRMPEPELMEAADQVAAYADADFSEAHDRLIDQIAATFPDSRFDGEVLDLGCGSGDYTFRFLNRYPDSRVVGVDGSAEMLTRARSDLASHHAALADRAEFVVANVPGEDIPRRPYIAVISNSLLHHVLEPESLWSTVTEHAKKGTAIFVSDLRRPVSIESAKELVRLYAAEYPEVLRTDFYNSLCAAYTADEVRGQLMRAGLTELKVSELGDRHMVISGLRGSG